MITYPKCLSIFFEDSKAVEDDLTSHCKKNANECLAQKQNDDEWKKILRSEKYECKLLLAVETRNESCFHAFKILLKDLCQKLTGNYLSSF